MTLLENLKKQFLKSPQKNTPDLSTKPHPERVDLNLDNSTPLGFFDEFSDSKQIYTDFSLQLDKSLELQNNWIKNYKRVSRIPEVSNAISEIVDEALFSAGKPSSMSLELNAELPKAIENKIQEEFKNLLFMLNLNKNLYSLFEKFYIEGQLILHCAFDNRDLKKGIVRISVLNPINFFKDNAKNIWRYRKHLDASDTNVLYSHMYGDMEFPIEFSNEEIIRIDSGVYENKVILSDLHCAVKVANNLQTLEEMLVPMRFSRSVSRRVFNIDVSNMNSKKAEEYLQQIQSKFKYKKFYDLESGQISNQQHVASLTEDYWFPNRSGQKGTQVETIDETGNLGETGDIDYFRKKLYTALKVPLARLGIDDKAEFDFTSTMISRDELKFFNFISRKRLQFSEIFIALLERQLISKGIMRVQEFHEIRSSLQIKWVTENKFFERMNDEQLQQAIAMFRDYEELVGKGWISKEFLYKKVLKFSQEEIQAIQDEIAREKNDPLYKDIKVGDDVEVPEAPDNTDNTDDADDDADDADEKDTDVTDDEDEEDTE